MSRHVVVTGASSGIGAAVARQLHEAGHRLSIGARRAERLADVGGPECFRAALDVTDEASVEAFLAGAQEAHGPVDVLVNNAGLARGVEKVAEATGEAWREMIEANVMGVLHVTRRVLPGMLERRSGQIVMIGSIAGHEPYEGGSVYCGSKHALRAITKSLRLETCGHGVRVCSVDPGMVETEFSLVRFRGDQKKADAVYRGMRPLTPHDVATCVRFVVELPPHVNVDDMLVMPTQQAAPWKVARDDTA